MEKLLKQIYYLHRKEIKDLESKIELLNKENLTIRNDQNCRRCLELEIALQKKTEDYLKLQRTQEDCANKSRKNGCRSFKKVTDKAIQYIKNEDENHSNAKIPEKDFKNARCLSMFDDISPIRVPSQNYNQINEHFSPVPETPLLLMKTSKSFSYSCAFENSSTVISETLDEGSICFAKSNSLKNVENPISINVAHVISVDETNNVDSVDFIENSVSPEVVMVSPVFSSQEKQRSLAVTELNASLDDFEIPKLFKRRREDDDSQKLAKLKKTAAKIADCKHSATSTNAKYSFIPAGKGYRKPKYKQTTLSQTFGERRNINKSSSRKPISDEHNIKKIKESSQNDIDCTFIPTQYLPNETVKKQETDNLDCEEIISINCPENDDTNSDTNSSEDLLASFLDTSRPKENGTQKTNQNSHKESNSMAKRDPFFDDFDVIPKSPIVNYKYMRDAVKKKDERNKLDGQQCLECEKYYNSLGLSEGEKKQRLNECSRHRNNFSRPKTPEHFWSPEFPTTQECKRRGMLEPTQDERKQEPRTRRPKK